MAEKVISIDHVINDPLQPEHVPAELGIARQRPTPAREAPTIPEFPFGDDRGRPEPPPSLAPNIPPAPREEASSINDEYEPISEVFDDYDVAPTVEQHDAGEEPCRHPSLFEEADLPEVQPDGSRLPALESPLEVPLQPLNLEGENAAPVAHESNDDRHSVTCVLGSPRGSEYTALEDTSEVAEIDYDDSHPLIQHGPEIAVEGNNFPQSHAVLPPAPFAQDPAVCPHDGGNPQVGLVPTTTMIPDDANGFQTSQIGQVSSRRSARTRYQTTFFSPDHYGQDGSYSSSTTQMPTRGSE
ncbi:hypothetical protein Pmar_PMAR001256 [Perkinsus marinus ATCC 50983]|uniref:Uncharacterized protein n=1 Tax=Perkinsus marinus (strain ATCC 50983 / TXsc) TaxID=423536 RepID=C5KTA9_PERM5|nr:hypothetical protein Pmar_PMAR001256 [Perkinsus marinus ATCC 50983]EER12459.1 hypothetical protein Pmar_PMAR001256 [Perkinsus marinus ATCC 50983]|eukprot:XP_002780664.1 hypothetical protein Pmar_PMAR001256 [Perkinsus marinus ATCC 50983]